MLTVLSVVALAACSAPPQPPGLLVVTDPPGASCLLRWQGQAIGIASPTPAIAHGMEGRSGVITVACERPGFADAVVSVPPAQPAPTGLFAGYNTVYPHRVDIALVPKPPSAP